MKTRIKILASVAVLAFFLLIGWATSYPDDDIYKFLTDLSFQNDSDSCTVTGVSLIYRARRDNDDTLFLPNYVLAPGDTILQTFERLAYKELDYTCNCPNDTTLLAVDMVTDTSYYQEIKIDCD